MGHTQKMAEENVQGQNNTNSTATKFCTKELRKRLTVLTFIVNLFYYPSAYLHLMTATLCKNYQNLVKNPNPIYNFKGVVEPLQKNLTIFALINLSLLILNAGIILFRRKIKCYWGYLFPILLTLLGMAVSVGAPTNVILTVSEWNSLNQSKLNNLTVYSSVFVGNLSGFETLFRLEIMLGWLVFFTSTIYTGIYWIILMRDQYINSKSIQTQKMVEIEDKSRAGQQKQVLQVSAELQ